MAKGKKHTPEQVVQAAKIIVIKANILVVRLMSSSPRIAKRRKK
jgi:hypothetical protein